MSSTQRQSDVQPSEKLSRFVYENSHITPKIRPDIFRADPYDNSVSVFRSNDKPKAEIWDICDRWGRTDKTALGRAELMASTVIGAGLGFDPDGIPHETHVAIVGWNPDKGVELERRKQLALASNRFMRPD